MTDAPADKRAVVVRGATGQAKVLNEALPQHHAELAALVDNRPIESPFRSIQLLRGESELAEWLKTRNETTYFCVAVGEEHGND